MEYGIKRGFGPSKVKEYFVVQADGDVLAGVVAGPFESERQCMDALEALRPLYFRRLCCIGGHMVEWNRTSNHIWFYEPIPPENPKAK